MQRARRRRLSSGWDEARRAIQAIESDLGWGSKDGHRNCRGGQKRRDPVDRCQCDRITTAAIAAAVVMSCSGPASAVRLRRRRGRRSRSRCGAVGAVGAVGAGVCRIRLPARGHRRIALQWQNQSQQQCKSDAESSVRPHILRKHSTAHGIIHANCARLRIGLKCRPLRTLGA
jgi:hypothetical protein